jgi:hypothetical protein
MDILIPLIQPITLSFVVAYAWTNSDVAIQIDYCKRLDWKKS